MANCTCRPTGPAWKCAACWRSCWPSTVRRRCGGTDQSRSRWRRRPSRGKPSMLATRQPVLRRFWYPVMPAALVDQGPQPFALLDERIVMWKDGSGRYAAMADRCPHRSAQLSKGWVDGNALVCPYDGRGTCVRVPQRPDSGGLKGTAVRTFACSERYGHVWVALDEPLAPIPDWSEETDPGYRRIDQFYEPWNCAGFRLMENSFDNAHIHFVHRRTFGNINDPDPPQPAIERFDYGFVARSDVPVFNTELQKKNLRDDSAFTVRHITAHWYMPFLRRLRPARDRRRPRGAGRHRLRRPARHEFGRRAPHAVRPARPAHAPHAARAF